MKNSKVHVSAMCSPAELVIVSSVENRGDDDLLFPSLTIILSIRGF